MVTLDLLITKFNEFKNELQKNSSLHDTVEGFMTGLKATPKGSPERGKFVTAHMNHGPFLSALSAHPQGQQVKGMLNSHLNSKTNAGFKAGQTVAVAKSDDLEDMLDKAMGGFKDKNMGMDASRAAHNAFMNKPMIAKPHPQSIPSPEEHASRASMYSEFTPAGKFTKTINNSYASAPNDMAMSTEKIDLDKNGQWNLKKDGLQDAIKNLKSSTKVTSAMNTLRAGPAAPVAKDEDKC